MSSVPSHTAGPSVELALQASARLLLGMIPCKYCICIITYYTVQYRTVHMYRKYSQASTAGHFIWMLHVISSLHVSTCILEFFWYRLLQHSTVL